MIKSEEARALLIKLNITNYTRVKCGFQPMTRQNTSKLGVKALLTAFIMGNKLREKG